eukprot:EG_transcript_12455
MMYPGNDDVPPSHSRPPPSQNWTADERPSPQLPVITFVPHPQSQAGVRSASPFDGHGQWSGVPPRDSATVESVTVGPRPSLGPQSGTRTKETGRYFTPAETMVPEEVMSVQNFLRLNPNLSILKSERDKALGWRRYLAAGLFAFALFSPVLGMVTNLKTNAWVIAVLWVIIAAITVFWIEYRCRAEVWYICLCRGIIVDFKKTHELKDWVLHRVMFLSYAFIVICGVVVGLASSSLSLWQRVLTGVLFAVGLAFVVLLARSFIDLEGAPRTLSVNLLLFHFRNPRLLRCRGFQLVHYTQLCQYLSEKADVSAFRWDDVFQLAEQPAAFAHSPFWGWRANRLLRRVKDQDR